MAFASTSTEFAMLDTRTTSGAFVLPLSTDIPGRIINIKDPYGAFGRSTLTVYTSGGDTFEDGTTSKFLNGSYDFMQLYAGSTTKWYITGGTYQTVDTANVAIISTLQTYNWASLCNAANVGYASTFNPPAIGEISLLDNIFTSSTAGLVSTFIEIGNLNAHPAGMNPGGIFRWVLGVEPNRSPPAGLDFKIKKWNSFGVSSSSTRYGANNSTLQDVVVFDNFGQMQFYGGSFFISSPTENPGIMRFTNVNNCNYFQFGSTANSVAGGTLLFTSPFAGQESMRISRGITGEVSAAYSRVGINEAAPAAALHVAGPVIFSNVANATNSGYGGVKILPNSNGGEALIAFFSTTAVNTQYPWFAGRSPSFGSGTNAENAGNFGISFIRAGNNTLSNTFVFTPNGQLGIGGLTPFSTFNLDVNGISRGKVPLSTISGTSVNLQTGSYGIVHNLINTGFNAVTLPSLGTAQSNQGWTVPLRNATGVAMSITITGAVSSTPPSPFPLASSNTANFYWDGALFRVF